MTKTANARVYLDWNATTPPHEDVLSAMMAAARDGWANPASIHGHGRAARSRVESARAAVAQLAGADARDVVLTSGGTEANNLALRSAFARPNRATDARLPILVTSRLEHPSITRVAEAMATERRAEVHWLRVLPSGGIDLEDLAACLARGGVRLVAVQAVNHETGVLQPVDEACGLAAAAGALVHVDAVQAFGRVAGGAGRFSPSSRSLAAHKFRGPKGIGALITQPGVRLEPVLLGGAQEKGIRPGTGDPLAAAGLAVAATLALSSPQVYSQVVAPLRDALEAGLLALGASRNGSDLRAPHVTNLAFAGWKGAELVAALDLEGVCVSSGSACSAGTIEPSPVVTAMAGAERAAASIRLSLGATTTESDVAAALHAFRHVLARSANGLGS